MNRKMNLQTKLKNELKESMKAKDSTLRDTIRLIMGELSRNDKKEFSDDEIISVIRKMIKSEEESLSIKGNKSSEYLKILKVFLPKQATQEEIVVWIKFNIDFSKYKNKMQAMGTIMKHFGSRTEGAKVKKIVDIYF